MAFKRVFALAILLVPASARGECETEAVKARNMILASGPFQYEGKYTGKPSWQGRWWLSDHGGDLKGPPEQKLSGLIEPLRAHHVFNAHQAYGFFALEEIGVGDQAWFKGDAGWYQPITFAVPQTARFLPSEDFGYIVSAKCLGPAEIEGKSLIGYELQYKPRLLDREHVFVEPGTGLTVRLEQFFPSGSGVINFRYDSSIKIEPPKIEIDAAKVPEPAIRFGPVTKF